MMTCTHVVRAVGAAVAVLLLAGSPAAAVAQEKPQPIGTAEPQPAAVPPDTSAESPTTISQTIHPGDRVAVNVYGEPPQILVVQADGTIQYPLAGRVFVRGMGPHEAADALAKALQRYVKHPRVTLTVQQQGAITVTVMGNVKTPGKYQLRSGSHIADAVAAAGGLAVTNGDYPLARVTQSDGGIAKVDLQQLIRQGDAAQNVALDDNALVYVTGAETIRVTVLGAVSRPGNVEINEGERLTVALARAGAEAAVKPDLNRVLLTRLDPVTKQQQSYQINVYQGLAQHDPRFDPILQKDDRIMVPEARQLTSTSISLLGILGRLLRL